MVIANGNLHTRENTTAAMLRLCLIHSDREGWEEAANAMFDVLNFSIDRFGPTDEHTVNAGQELVKLRIKALTLEMTSTMNRPNTVKRLEYLRSVAGNRS